jgi:hypothetical protein
LVKNNIPAHALWWWPVTSTTGGGAPTLCLEEGAGLHEVFVHVGHSAPSRRGCHCFV